MTNPKQSKTLHIEMLGEELSVYDWKRLKMHSLNPTATKVFALCDGMNSPAQMAARLAMPEAAIWQALDELSKANLLQATAAAPSDMSRRAFLKLGGAVAAAAIVSIVVPHPVAAQSAGCTITRTTIATNITSAASFDRLGAYYPLNAPITAAEIASCGITRMIFSWTGSPIADAGAGAAGLGVVTLAQNSTTIAGSNNFLVGTASPTIDVLYTPGFEPYNGLLIGTDLNVSWDVGQMTVTFLP